MPTDVADFAADRARGRIEVEEPAPGRSTFGLDLSRSSSVFAPVLAEVRARRQFPARHRGQTTSASSMARWPQLLARCASDLGTIVQVGSALGAQAIPLQSAYCGAMHESTASPSRSAASCSTTVRTSGSRSSRCQR